MKQTIIGLLFLWVCALASAAPMVNDEPNLFFTTAPLHVGAIGPDGKFVILTSYDRFATLNEDYGFFIWGPYGSSEIKDGRKDHRVEFHFFSQPQRKFVVTHDLTELLKLISTVPQGEKIYFYNRCNAPTWFGIADKKLQKMLGAIVAQVKTANLIFVDNYLIDTCIRMPTYSHRSAQPGGPAEATAGENSPLPPR
ncbi:MAG: hypothetical protein IPO76_06455 [Elusimicrobia bacterium]|nr:hypothetical protein [Elusimicrobiota bacterium]